jgi:Ion transport protein
LNHFKGKIIDDKQLKYIVESYIENNELKLEDLNKEYFKEAVSINKSGIDSYSILVSLQSHYLYQLAKGVLNIIIVCLTMSIIDIFHTGPGADSSNKSTSILKIQVGLLFLSLMEQSVGIVVRGFRQTFKSLLLTFEIVITLVALIIGLMFISFKSLDLLLAYDKTSSLFKLFALATIGKTISVIMFLRIIREIRIVLDVLINSAIFLIDVIGMMGIVMLLFSSVGITMFGGVMNSKALAGWKAIITDDDFDEGSQYLNFNDYFNSLLMLLTIIFSGWQDPLKMMCFSMPNRNYNHNYFFVAFFVCANLFLLNVLIGFIIDNIVAYLSEDIIIENADDMKFKSQLKGSFFGKFVMAIKEKTIDKVFAEKSDTGAIELEGIILTDKS